MATKLKMPCNFSCTFGETSRNLIGKIQSFNRRSFKMSEPIHVTDATFKEEVLDSDIPVVVDFWAEWCMPCKAIAPVIEELAEEYEGRVKVTKVDVDNNQEVAGSLGIRSIPMLFFFKDGERVDQIIGAVPKQKITEKLESML